MVAPCQSLKTFLWVLALVILGTGSSGCSPATPAADQEKAPARNVILMIADGAGFNAFRAGAASQTGDSGNLPQREFPVYLGVTTFSVQIVNPSEPRIADATLIGYDSKGCWETFHGCSRNADANTTDSAAASTALNTGTKTANGRVAVATDGETRLETFAEYADGLGKATGVVTSVQVSHATPAAVAAHVGSRDDTVKIFRQMLYESPLDVIMGCGHPLGGNTKRAYAFVGGEETWADLTDGDGANGFTFIEHTADFLRLAAANPQANDRPPTKIVGVVQRHRTLNEKVGATTQENSPPAPSLATLTTAALNVLEQGPEGFYLLVEGGAIDWANHENDMSSMLQEMREFTVAVEAVVNWVETFSSWEETLLIVTSDHETGQLWGAGTYTDIDRNSRFNEDKESFLGWKPVQSNGKGEIPSHQYGSSDHTNELVPLWAKGRGSERFAGLTDGTDRTAAQIWGFSGEYIDNTDIYTVMRAAVTP